MRTAAKNTPQGSKGRKELRQADLNLQGVRKPSLPYPPGTGRRPPTISCPQQEIKETPRYHPSPAAKSAPCPRPSCEDLLKFPILPVETKRSMANRMRHPLGTGHLSGICQCIPHLSTLQCPCSHRFLL